MQAVTVTFAVPVSSYRDGTTSHGLRLRIRPSSGTLRYHDIIVFL
jgi:hypothetical protein